MRVYVETNFLVEIVLAQEELSACEEILSICEGGSAELVIPAFSIPEAYHSLIGKHSERKQVKKQLDSMVDQLARSSSFHVHDTFEAVKRYLVDSTQLEEVRFHETADKVIRGATRIIPLTTEVIQSADGLRSRLSLKLPDSVVLASVLSDLTGNPTSEACFVTRDTDITGDPDTKDELRSRGCELKPRFGAGLSYIRSRIGDH